MRLQPTFPTRPRLTKRAVAAILVVSACGLLSACAALLTRQGTQRVTRQGTQWREQAHFNGVVGPLALSGDTAIASANDARYACCASGDSNKPLGTLDVFVRHGTSWRYQMTLTPGPAPSTLGATAISGQTIVVGEPIPPPFPSVTTGPPPNVSGRAYVYVRDGSTWRQQAELLPPDPSQFSGFGQSVAASGNIIAVSGSTNYARRRNVDVCFVFERRRNVWHLEAELSDPSKSDSSSGMWMLAVDNGTLVVGGSENYRPALAVYAFVHNAGTWVREATLRPSDGSATNESVSAVAVHGATIAVGVSGAKKVVYLYARTGPGWRQQAELTVDSCPAQLYSPCTANMTLALGETTLAVVAAGTNSVPGKLVVFQKQASRWHQQATLIAPGYILSGCAANPCMAGGPRNGAGGFNGPVGISGNTIVAGADNQNDTEGRVHRPNDGDVAYVFVLPTRTPGRR